MPATVRSWSRLAWIVSCVGVILSGWLGRLVPSSHLGRLGARTERLFCADVVVVTGTWDPAGDAERREHRRHLRHVRLGVHPQRPLPAAAGALHELTAAPVLRQRVPELQRLAGALLAGRLRWV